MNYIVSRHPGALEWVQRQLGEQPCITLSHLDEGFVSSRGDRVFGVLSLPWVERIHRAGAQAWVLEVDLPAALRGEELSADQLDALSAILVRYEARAIESRSHT